MQPICFPDKTEQSPAVNKGQPYTPMSASDCTYRAKKTSSPAGQATAPQSHAARRCLPVDGERPSPTRSSSTRSAQQQGQRGHQEMKEVGSCCLYMWARVREARRRESRRDTPDITFCQSARPMWGWARSITCNRCNLNTCCPSRACSIIYNRCNLNTYCPSKACSITYNRQNLNTYCPSRACSITYNRWNMNTCCPSRACSITYNRCNLNTCRPSRACLITYNRCNLKTSLSQQGLLCHLQ